MKSIPPKTIEITISAAGDVKLTTHGFAGDSCRQASRFLEAALGKTASETLTSEYHHQQVSAELEQRSS